MLGVSLVGRTAEVADLCAAWADHALRPAVALVTGEPGAGKSALVAHVQRRLAPARVLAGRARLHSPAPYDWLAGVLCGRELRDLPVPAGPLAWLAQQPELPSQRYAPGALLRLAVQVVRHLIGAGPALVVVEDLHALDPASLNLLTELAHTPELPAMLLVTSRPTGDPLAALALAQLAGAPGALRRHLGPLPRDAVVELVRRTHPDADAGQLEWLWRHSGGNPYALTELLARGVPAVGEAAELTGREWQVLDCLAAGMSNKQVARQLGISVRTVAVHVSNVLRKTGTASRTEAALWAVGRREPHPVALLSPA
jgi:DNA-binding NarL/FixJ family response regulator